jgi:hypothetical protein
MSFITLPDEMLLAVLRRCSPEDVAVVSKTCRRLHALCQAPYLWEGLYQLQGKPLPSEELIQAAGWKVLVLTPQSLWDALRTHCLKLKLQPILAPRFHRIGATDFSLAKIIRSSASALGKLDVWIKGGLKVEIGTYFNSERELSFPPSPHPQLITSVTILSDKTVVARTNFGTLVSWPQEQQDLPKVLRTVHGTSIILDDELTSSGDQAYAKAIPAFEGNLGLNAQVMIYFGGTWTQIEHPFIGKNTHFLKHPEGTLFINYDQVGIYSFTTSMLRWESKFEDLTSSEGGKLQAATLFDDRLIFCVTLNQARGLAKHFLVKVQLSDTPQLVLKKEITYPLNHLFRIGSWVLGLSFFEEGQKITKFDEKTFEPEVFLGGLCETAYKDALAILKFKG